MRDVIGFVAHCNVSFAWSDFMGGKSPFQREKSVVGVLSLADYEDAVRKEARVHLSTLAEPAIPGELVCAAIQRAARRAGISACRASKIWYGNARAILGWEIDLLREKAAAAAQGKQYEMGQYVDDLTRELDELEISVAKIRKRLAGQAFAETGGQIQARR